MAFSDTAALVQGDSDYRRKIQVAIVRSALDVVGEARPGVSTGAQAYYNQRHALGVAILNDSAAYVDRFAWAVAVNPVITAESPDGDIEYTVHSVFDDIAGVNADEIPA